ncbi:MAG: hypothetical protein IH586_00735 [Anaerolineaceae bacterium]|nr:hypothetical protein [Anaerolineaceae bacterium]
MWRNSDPRLAIFGWFWVAFLFLLAGCTPAFTRTTPQNSTTQTPFFRPPAAQILPTATVIEAIEILSTPTITCKDQLKFLSDLTIPDGTVVAPDSTLDKRWEVENSGNCNWDEKYRVRLIAGPELSAQKEQALYPARSGTRAVIRFIFKAPLETGSYRSAWQAYDPNGEPFGDPFFIDIIVQ